MNLTLVMYSLKVGSRKFLKQILVQFIPLAGSYLKVANYSFVVVEFEQDLDAYSDKHYEHGASCESVRAKLNIKCHNEDDYPFVMEALNNDGWSESGQ
jgi:hypothetical protein